jgi:hypothetical protein
LNYYVGPSNFNTQKGYRNLIDTTLLLTPTPKFSAYVNYDYGKNRIAAYSYSSGSTTVKVPTIDPLWQGVAFSAREQATANAALVARFEYFYDNQGYETGIKQKLDEFTATYEYKWPVGLLLRAEYRVDWSDHKFFDRGNTGTSDNQNTFTVGMIAFFGPKR